MQSTAQKKIDHQNPKPNPLEIFRVRCEARAHLVANGLHNLQESVDVLQESAAAQGLVKKHGQDAIQEILAASFARWRYG